MYEASYDRDDIFRQIHGMTEMTWYDRDPLYVYIHIFFLFCINRREERRRERQGVVLSLNQPHGYHDIVILDDRGKRQVHIFAGRI